MPRKTILVPVLLLSMVNPASAEPPAHHRAVARQLGDAHVLRERAFGAEEAYAPDILHRVGGVLFQGHIANHGLMDDLASAEITRADDVATIILHFDSDTSFSYTAPFWIVGPAISFGVSDYTAAVSLFGDPTDAEAAIISPKLGELQTRASEITMMIDQANRCFSLLDVDRDGRDAPVIEDEQCTDAFHNLAPLEEEIEQFDMRIDAAEQSLFNFLYDYFLTMLHPDLINSALGLRLMQADSMLIDNSYGGDITVFGKVASFPSEMPATALDYSVRIANQLCDEYAPDAWLLTDIDTTYTLSLTNDSIVIGGNPYYYFWRSRNDHEIEALEACTNLFRDSNLLDEQSPVWEAVRHAARIAALMRSIKDKKPTIAEALGARARESDLNVVFRTPRAWPRDGYVDVNG